jgi:hypothetical protein
VPESAGPRYPLAPKVRRGLCPGARHPRSASPADTGQCHPDTSLLGLDTLAGMMRLHPALQAAHEIRQALSVLTDYSWPVP